MSGCPFRNKVAANFDSKQAAQKEADLQWVRHRGKTDFTPVYCAQCRCWHAVVLATFSS